MNARTWLAATLIFIAGQAALAQEKTVDKAPEKTPDTIAEDHKALRDVGVKTDGASLLEYFRKRTFAEADPAKVKNLIRDLGDEDFQVREKAHLELLTLGPGAVAGLKQAENHANTEIRRRVADLKGVIEAKADPAVQAAVARLIAQDKPAGSPEVILAYIPFAADLTVVDELCTTLGQVAGDGNKVDPLVLKAVEDKHPLRRAAAGQALTALKNGEHLPAARKLLKDSDPAVRLRLSMALLKRREKEALPVLVDALAHLPREQLWPAEELLGRLAGEKAPSVSLGGSEVERKACRDAWARWLETDGSKLDLAKVNFANVPLGYTLLVQQRNNGGGQILELDKAKKVRWSFDLNTYPVDAQIIGPDRVLVAEYQGGQVSIRDFKGNVKWQLTVNGNPIGVQRLPNGNIFVVMQNRLTEYDAKGKELFNFQGPIMFRARKLPNEEIIFITNAGQLVRMEAKTQKQVKNFGVGNLASLFGNVDITPNGNILVPQFQNNQVVEFDKDGKQVGNAVSVNFPNSVVRLTNGNLLVGSLNNRAVTEFDRAGRVVWSHQSDGMVFNARRR